MPKKNHRWTGWATLALIAFLPMTSGATSTQESPRPPLAVAGAFPPAAPESVGLPTALLDRLSEQVQKLVDDEDIVGGELLVIKDRRTVLRRAFGWQDREAEIPMAVGATYCVRSMTKPLVGTAIQMLIDEGRLRRETPIHEILPAFDKPGQREITVEHLLTHTSGLPLSVINQPLVDYPGLAGVAAAAADVELGFEPGTRFQYSDAGSDVLGAIVTAVTGTPVATFIQQRILAPLGMRETLTLLPTDPAQRPRIPSAYSGGTGSWQRYWQGNDPRIFPFFLTSQSLYSTTTDYARFLALWLDGGHVGSRQLLTASAVERALTPTRRLEDYPRNFRDLNAYYAEQWMVFADPDESEEPRRVVFGHGGSDGTHAWVWPAEDLMVLFFTQSRGTLAGLSLEGSLQSLLVDRRLDSPSPKPVVSEVTPREEAVRDATTGLYWDETNETAYYVVTEVGERLRVERPGRMSLVLSPGEVPGRFVYPGSPKVWAEFVRNDDGDATAMRYAFGGKVEVGPRFVEPEGLPSAKEVVSAVRDAHHMDRLPAAGVVRLSGSVRLVDHGLTGDLTLLFDDTRARARMDLGSAQEISVVDADRAWSYSTVTGTDQLQGWRLEQARLDRYSVIFGNWLEHYESVDVLGRIEHDDATLLLVRAVPHGVPGATFFVEEASGRVRRMDTLVQVPGMGIVGVESTFDDYRDVDGLLLPFRTRAEFSTPQIGRINTRLKRSEVGVEVPADAFAPPVGPER
ncbi:MAG: beta-lactamase family protein [Thermoanaerobaculia bacterium]|nr:beta-lactamase family protein [Thermoanaerobaculia bacterium]